MATRICRWLVVGLCAAPVGCSVSSIDSEMDRLIKVCESIRDDRARADCVAALAKTRPRR